MEKVNGTRLYQLTVETAMAQIGLAEGLYTGDANKDGAATRAALKALGIKPTYKCIKAWLEA